jgi:signal transduction histidine kinase
MHWEPNALIPLSAVFLYGVLFLVVSFSRSPTQTQARRIFREYLLAMGFWSLSAFLVLIVMSGVVFWFRLMLVSAIASEVAIFRFVQKVLVRRWSWIVWFYLYAIIGMGITLFTDLVVRSVSVVGGVLSYEFAPLFVLIAGPGYGLTIFSLIMLQRGYREYEDPLQRNRLRYLMIGLSMVILSSLVNFTPLGRYPIDIAGNGINALLIAYAILRHQLLDIQVVVRKGLLYSIPTVLIGAGYFLIIEFALRLMSLYSGLQIFILSLLVAILTALVAQPLRDKAQSGIDRFFFREKYDSGLMLQRLSSKAASVLDLDKITNMILEEVSSVLHIQKAAFFLKRVEAGEFYLMARKGMVDNTTLRFNQSHPIVQWLSSYDDALTKHDLSVTPQFKSLWGKEYQDLEKLGSEIFIPVKAKGELVAIFVLGPKRSEQIYSADEILTLTTLANQIAVAIENARLYWDLERTLYALRQAHDELENRVQQRTSDLAQVNLVLQDEVSERKRAEESIQRYASELERSNQELQQFAYVASHDLQEPLRMVSSFLQLLEKRYQNQLDKEAIEFIGFAVDGAKRMQALINDLLAYSRVGTRGNPFTRVDCQALLNHVLDNLKLAKEESQAEIISEGLPTVMGDGTQLEQVFQNLIANAIKFHGLESPRIKVGAERREHKWLFWVADNGIGIDPQYAERIFLIFQRLHTRDEYPGTGIGLAICKRIIDRHAGRIWMESDPASGKPGTTFYFTIPDKEEML